MKHEPLLLPARHSLPLSGQLAINTHLGCFFYNVAGTKEVGGSADRDSQMECEIGWGEGLCRTRHLGHTPVSGLINRLTTRQSTGNGLHTCDELYIKNNSKLKLKLNHVTHKISRIDNFVVVNVLSNFLVSTFYFVYFTT